MASKGKCNVDEIKVGAVQMMRNGLYTVWVRCPLTAAVSIATLKKIGIGWTFAKVELLKARPVQCFKCWAFGHVRFSCTANIDRSNSCFNCGREGHSLRNCRSPPHCVICAAEGRRDDHRLGSNLCEASKEKPRRGRPRFNVSESIVPGRRTDNETEMDNDV